MSTGKTWREEHGYEGSLNPYPEGTVKHQVWETFGAGNDEDRSTNRRMRKQAAALRKFLKANPRKAKIYQQTYYDQRARETQAIRGMIVDGWAHAWQDDNNQWRIAFAKEQIPEEDRVIPKRIDWGGFLKDDFVTWAIGANNGIFRK